MPGSAPPVSSVTNPEIDPVVPCADPSAAGASIAIRTSAVKTLLRAILNNPPRRSDQYCGAAGWARPGAKSSKNMIQNNG
ncbi:MAG: hypothetical protein DMF96_16965 [Acidobacteria bacterium]|nr:MAG: hypothetical protein DMF96_16965 [Acidobacteriota bacterium]